MKSVKLLQILAQHHSHLQEQPQKALVDILSEVRAAQLFPGHSDGANALEQRRPSET